MGPRFCFACLRRSELKVLQEILMCGFEGQSSSRQEKHRVSGSGFGTWKGFSWALHAEKRSLCLYSKMSDFCNLKTKICQITCKLGIVALSPTCVTCLLNAEFVKASWKSRAVKFYFQMPCVFPFYSGHCCDF